MSKPALGLGTPLTAHQIRLSVASEPATFLILLAGLLTTCVFADPLILIAVVGTVAGVVTASPWIAPLHRRSNARYLRQRQRQHTRQHHLKEQQALRALPIVLQNRFWVIRNRVWSVSHNIATAHDEPGAYTWQHLQAQLTRLPETALYLLRELNNVERLLEQADELLIYRQIDELEKNSTDVSPRLRAIRASRKAILHRRQDIFQQAHEEREVILTQLAMIEDSIDLLRDSSLISDDTHTVTRQLDEMMLALDAMEEAIKDTQAIATGDSVAQLAVFEERLAC